MSIERLRKQIPLSILAATAAGLCWSAALSLLLFGGLHAGEPPFSLQRLVYYTLVLAAALLTFAPIECSLSMPGLTVDGTVGTALLLYSLAFVPPPTDWLLAPPDMPVYALMIGALFLCGAAGSQPFVYAIGQRVFKERVLALDLRRVRRQSYEIGLLLAALATLAGLRVLTWVSFLLLALALIIAELLFLARFQAKTSL
ncbi:MAG: hypothetical protein WCK70_11140 [Chloroflexales bacterium]